MNQTNKYLTLAGGIVFSFFAQQLPPMQSQSPSTVSLSSKGDAQTLEIHNSTYEVAWGPVPGRPRNEKLLLRKTDASKQVIGDMGQDSSTTLEAWPLGVDLKQKPLYSVKVSGTGGRTVDGALYVADRGLEEVEWWSVYRLGNGQHLFDSYVPVLAFSISRDILEQRYVGLEVPPDDTKDARLTRPNVIAVVTYASNERVRKEALLTSDDPKQAALLRSFADTTRTVQVTDAKPARGVKLVFQVNDPAPSAPVTLTIPIAADDLDLAHAQLPSRLHLAAWKR